VPVPGSISAALPESTSSSPLTIEKQSASFPPDPSSSGGRQQEKGVQDKEVVMEEALLRTRLSRYGPVQTLYASGELDIASGPVLEHAVARALDGQGGEFHLDLGGLTFMDSSGAEALLSAHNRVESLGRRLVIVSPSGPVRRVLALMALEQVLDVRSPAEPASDIGGFFAYD
jgi:anti-anti-sigma factor